MRRDLPARASLEHLKKQAKDLLDAHKRGDRQALGRIRDCLPAYASMNDDAILAAAFALHDAQSVLAREYGKASWKELREAVAAQEAARAGAPSDALLRALMPLPFPGEIGPLIREAGQNRTLAVTAAEAPLSESLPLVAMRDALFVPRAIGPISVGRPSSLAAIDLGLRRTPPTVAVFAQKNAADGRPDALVLHPVGCEVCVHARVRDGEAHAWVVLEGVRWIALDSLAPGPEGSTTVRVRPMLVEPGDAAETAPLAASLRARVRDLASAFPDADRLLAIIDAAQPHELADLAVANMPGSVAEKAAYAAEPRLAERLRIADALAARRQAG